MNFTSLNNAIALLNHEAMAAAQAHWDRLAKPLGSLGWLEANIIKIAGLTGNANVRLDRRVVVVLCADNGVVAENVTQAGSGVTALVAENIAQGKSSVGRMAQVANADIIAVDMGMERPVAVPGLVDRRIAPGTANISQGPAMTSHQALRAIRCGMQLAKQCARDGYKILATGEMGIGNTTTSSAMAAVLLNLPVREVTGRGAGLSDAGLERKIQIIERAISVNNPQADDALDILYKLGGFDIAAMVGLFLGGAVYRIPVLVDGFISAIAALTAVRLCPHAMYAALASHVSAEPASRLVLEELGLKPLICAGLRLGEGTGAVAALPLLDMALSVYHGMPSFADIGMDDYVPLGGDGP